MKIEELHKHFTNSNGICTDTRKIEAGTIFFALKGENFNANEFVKDALDAGCVAAVVDEEQGVIDDRCIRVESVLDTLQKLARFHRRQFDIPVIGITGSNGKTTSKELIGAVLSEKYKVLVTEGNLNNHLGVPFTLLRLTDQDEVALIEMGASKPGDIKELTEIAEPTIGIITNIGTAHIQGFGSHEGVIQTKTEMYRFIGDHNGEIIYNMEDEILKTHLPDGVPTFTYGSSGANVSGELIKLDPFIHFKWTDGTYESPVLVVHLVGEYNFTNFLLAIAVGRKFDVPPDRINEALTDYEPSNNRSQVADTERNRLIVDCYNANPSSMMAALKSFVQIDHDTKLVILGDMLELGEISQNEHKGIITFLEENNLTAYLVGKEFGKIKSDYPHFSNADELMKEIDLLEIRDSLILLKGSRGIRLEKLIEHL